MKDGFSMKLIDVVNDTEFKHILQQTVSRYMDMHYKSVGTSVKRDDRLKRTPYDALYEQGLLNVESLSVIGVNLMTGVKVELPSVQRAAAKRWFDIAAQHTLDVRHKERLAAAREAER